MVRHVPSSPQWEHLLSVKHGERVLHYTVVRMSEGWAVRQLRRPWPSLEALVRAHGEACNGLPLLLLPDWGPATAQRHNSTFKTLTVNMDPEIRRVMIEAEHKGWASPAPAVPLRVMLPPEKAAAAPVVEQPPPPAGTPQHPHQDCTCGGGGLSQTYNIHIGPEQPGGIRAGYGFGPQMAPGARPPVDRAAERAQRPQSSPASKAGTVISQQSRTFTNTYLEEVLQAQ